MEQQQQQKRSARLIVKVVLAVLFLISPLDMPYGYYQILRLAGMFGFIILVFLEGERRGSLMSILWIFSAILINPIFKVSLDKPVWVVIDIAWSLILLLTAWVDYRRGRDKASGKKT